MINRTELIIEDNEVINDYSLIGMLKADETTSSKRRLINKSGSLLEYQKVALENNDRDMLICFCITMYNEDWEEFQKTLSGIIDNIYRILNGHTNYHANQFAIFLIADGLAPLKYDDFLAHAYKVVNGTYRLADFNKLNSEENKRILGIFPKELSNTREPTYDITSNMKFTKNDHDVISDYFIKEKKEEFGAYLLEKNVVHLFGTKGKCDLGLTTNRRYRELDGDKYHFTTDLNFYFAIKHIYGGKLDSHYWFFKGFCEYINPRYTFLIDCGTRPMDDSIAKIFSYMENNKRCGGCSGEVQLEMDKCTNPLIFAENFKQKYYHMINKAYSTLGLSVIPTNFTMFRWKAIMGYPLSFYFIGLSEIRLNCKYANILLAADRLLCLTILSRPESKYFLCYENTSYAETPALDSMMPIISHEIRNINGNTFSSVFMAGSVISGIFKTKHNICKKLSVAISMVLMVIKVMMSLLSPVIVCLLFVQLNDAIIGISIVKLVLKAAYGSVLFIILIMAIASPLHKAICHFRLSFLILGVFFIMTIIEFYMYLVRGIKIMVKNGNILSKAKIGQNLYLLMEVISSSLILCTHILVILVNSCRPFSICKMVFGWLIYIFSIPFYDVVCVILACCNVPIAMLNDRKINEYSVYRAGLIAILIAASAVLYLLVDNFGKLKSGSYITIEIVAYTYLAISILRLLSGIVYSIIRCFQKIIPPKIKTHKIKKAAIPEDLC